MEEYRIVKQVGKAKPYSLFTFKNFNDCYLHLIKLIEQQQTEINKKYYVSNSFFNNKYPPFTENIVIYKIEVRTVKEWKEYKEHKTINKKIIPFNI